MCSPAVLLPVLDGIALQVLLTCTLVIALLLSLVFHSQSFIYFRSTLFVIVGTVLECVQVAALACFGQFLFGIYPESTTCEWSINLARM